MVVFIAESVIGLLSYVYQDRLGPDLEKTLTKSFISSYGMDHDRTLAADNIQLKVRIIKLQQSGFTWHPVYNHTGWRHYHELVLSSCLRMVFDIQPH